MTIDHATWPANCYGGNPQHADSSWSHENGRRRIVIASGQAYRPPEGWEIYSVKQRRNDTVIHVVRAGDDE